MERRNFIMKAGATAAATGLLAACSSSPGPQSDKGPAIITNPKVQWRLTSSYPRSLDTIFGASEVMAKRVAQLTDGNFTIRSYPAGELVPGLQVLDAVMQGTVQMGHSASYYFTGKNPSLAFDCAVPFGLNARQQNAWLYHGGGMELMRGVFADFNVLNFPGGNTGTQMGGWFRNEVNTLEDMKSLKMRIPGQGGEVMTRMGATVQVLAGGDIYPALERGAIDATEWVGPYDDEQLGFYKIAKNYYYPGWWEPGPNTSFYVSRPAWEQLPKAYQAAIEVACAEANLDMMAKYDARNPAALTRLLAQGVVLRPFSQEIMTSARAHSQALLEELSAKDQTFQKIYTEWNKFRTESNRWSATAEHSYSAFTTQ